MLIIAEQWSVRLVEIFACKKYNTISKQAEVPIMNLDIENYLIERINNLSCWDVCEVLKKFPQTPGICEAVLNRSPDFIAFLDNPTEEQCLFAVKNNPLIILDLENPSEKLWIEAINGCEWLFIDCLNPTELICMEAVRINGELLSYIKNPSEAVCLEAVKNDPLAIRYIKNADIKEKISNSKKPSIDSLIKNVIEQKANSSSDIIAKKRFENTRRGELKSI